MKQLNIPGYIQAIAQTTEDKHPFQTRIKLVLTPFTANLNKQGIPLSEASNFIKYAQNQPLKVKMSPYGPLGHDYAVPVGPIVAAEQVTLGNEEVIIGEAVLWNTEFPDVAEFLKTSEKEVHTSWEVFYTDSEIIDDVEWLHGVVFAGTCIVDDPAYAGKTPILAIAERKRMNELEEKIAALTAQLEEFKTKYETDVVAVQTALSEKDTVLAEKDTTVATLTAKVEELSAAVETYKQAELEAQAAAKKQSVVAQLLEVGFTQEVIDENLDKYLELSEEAFSLVISGAKLLANKSTAENKNNKMKLPDPKNTGGITDAQIVQALKNKR